MTTTIDKPKPLDVTSSIDPSKISQRRITADVEGDQINSSTANAGNTKIFEASKKGLGKQDFLKLLVTQLKFQDPLSPTENTEFVAQLAQFSNLEGTQNINTSIEDLSKKIEAMVSGQSASATSITNASATSLIGKQARVMASDIIFDPNSKTPIEFNVHADAGSISTLSISDAKDNVIQVIPIEKNGEFIMKWDGTMATGTKAEAGPYKVRVTSGDGRLDTGYAYLEDRITGVNYSKSGVRLEIKGQSIGMEQVVHIGQEVQTEEAKTEE